MSNPRGLFILRKPEIYSRLNHPEQKCDSYWVVYNPICSLRVKESADQIEEQYTWSVGMEDDEDICSNHKLLDNINSDTDVTEECFTHIDGKKGCYWSQEVLKVNKCFSTYTETGKASAKLATRFLGTGFGDHVRWCNALWNLYCNVCCNKGVTYCCIV